MSPFAAVSQKSAIGTGTSSLWAIDLQIGLLMPRRMALQTGQVFERVNVERESRTHDDCVGRQLRLVKTAAIRPETEIERAIRQKGNGVSVAAAPPCGLEAQRRVSAP
ncbi:hypothetical protein ACFSTD_01845 [Novosphingobium colocasiae]